MKSAAAQPKRTLADEIGKKNPFDSAAQEAYLNIVRSADQLTWAYERAAKAYGLSTTLYNVLRIVQGNGERGVHTQTISQDLITRQPDVTRLVDRLEKLGLVERERCGVDRRVVWVRITAAGRQKVKAVDADIARIHEAQLGHMSKTKLQQLSDLLVEARSHLVPE